MNRSDYKGDRNVFDDNPISDDQKLVDDHMAFLTNMEQRLLKAHRVYESEMREYDRWMREQVAKHFYKHGVSDRKPVYP